MRRVALLAEGVDRNSSARKSMCAPAHVALLAEGVDRNLPNMSSRSAMVSSPSSRRAWIEIHDCEDACVTLIGRPPRGGRG